MHESPPYKQLFVGDGAHPPFMRLPEHLTALRSWCKQCLPGRRKPDMLCPGFVWMRKITGHDYGHARHEYTHPPPPALTTTAATTTTVDVAATTTIRNSVLLRVCS